MSLYDFIPIIKKSDNVEDPNKIPSRLGENAPKHLILSTQVPKTGATKTNTKKRPPIPEGYMTTEQYAAIHHMGFKLVSKLCLQGKIQGALKKDRTWYIKIEGQ